MAKKSLQLGRAVDWPDSPDKAVLDRVPNPQSGTDYLVRFTAPEFTSICPVTGQPDFASVQVRYRGAAIDRERLLAYLVSFRRHPGFHEHCVERIFADVWQRCRPQWLAIQARFTRRGGVDINPWRSSGTEAPPANRRTTRQ